MDAGGLVDKQLCRLKDYPGVFQFSRFTVMYFTWGSATSGRMKIDKRSFCVKTRKSIHSVAFWEISLEKILHECESQPSSHSDLR